MNGQALSRLLRLRRAQHDLSVVAVVRARGDLDAAREESERRAEALAALRLPAREDAAVWLAVAASRRSAAEAVRAGLDLVRHAETGVEDAVVVWQQTRTAARGMERLAERAAEEARRDELAAEQREQDERSAARHASARAEGEVTS